MIEPQIVNEVWPQVRFEWCVFLCKILMCLNALLILHCKYGYFASSGQSHWHLLEGVAELCVGDFLIESVYNLRKYIKNLVFLTFWFYQPPSHNWIQFFLRIPPQRAAHFFGPAIFLKTKAAQLRDLGAPARPEGFPY